MTTSDFSIPFRYSIFKQIIEPYCDGLYKAQRHYLDTFSVAYIPPGAGALYDTAGRVRRSDLGEAFLSARRNLLNANKRMLVDLRQVSDPEYRSELERAGVKVSPVNAKLSGPGITGHELLEPDIRRRRKVPRPPKAARVSPFAGVVQLLHAEPVKVVSKPRARKGRLRPEVWKDGADRKAIAIGVTATAAAITAGAVVGLTAGKRKKS